MKRVAETLNTPLKKIVLLRTIPIDCLSFVFEACTRESIWNARLVCKDWYEKIEFDQSQAKYTIASWVSVCLNKTRWNKAVNCNSSYLISAFSKIDKQTTHFKESLLKNSMEKVLLKYQKFFKIPIIITDVVYGNEIDIYLLFSGSGNFILTYNYTGRGFYIEFGRNSNLTTTIMNTFCSENIFDGNLKFYNLIKEHTIGMSLDNFTEMILELFFLDEWNDCLDTIRTGYQFSESRCDTDYPKETENEFYYKMINDYAPEYE